MSANFTPDLDGYSNVSPFKFWCQKVLPLVYDDSLSYYETLCKITQYLNTVIENTATTEENIKKLLSAYNELQTYVNNYFTNLDVQNEINKKLDEMASNGTLTSLISPLLPDLISAWLEENITPTTPAVDKTLTISGAAADAKVTGDKLNECYCYRGELYPDSNIDDLKEVGWWRWVGTNTPTTLPVANTPGVLEFIGPNNAPSIAIHKLTYSNGRCFVRWLSSTGWGDFIELARISDITDAIDNNNTLTYQYRGEIFSDTEIDELKSPGWWRWIGANTPGSLPIQNTPGILEFMGPDSAPSISIQKVTYSNGRCFVRWLSSSGWGSFIELARISDIDDAISEQEKLTYRYRGELYSESPVDTLKEIGWWRWTGVNAPTALPLQNTPGILEFIGPDLAPSISVQRVTYSNGRCFVRWLSSTGWGDFIELARISDIEYNETRIFTRNTAFFGASEIYGTNGDGGITSFNITETLEKMLKIKCDNYGVGGTGFIRKSESLNKNAYELISSKNINDYDTIFMIYGGNDGFNPIGEYNTEDEFTCLGQFNKIIKYIYSVNNKCRVIVVAPLNGRNAGSFPDYWYGTPGGAAYSRGELSDQLKKACEYYNIPYIEQTTSPINAYTINTLIGADGVHLSNDGYQRVGEWLAGQIKALIG